VRHHFGISAFGVNAVTKDAGNVLIPEHDERTSGQQELYFVHAGEVRATLDGEPVTISAGGMVSIDPNVTRKIEATASPTTLVVVGATPGKAYEIGDWET
jgi:quercetin dioxygenase-like cupin family protein